MKKRFAKGTSILPIFILLILLFFAWKAVSYQYTAPPLFSKPLPTFDVPNVFANEKRLTDKELRTHRFALLNIWASWCRACRREHPILMEIKKQNIVPIYGINYRDNPESAKQWLIDDGNPYTLTGYDEMGSLGFALGIEGIPQTLLIDEKGTIRYQYVGAIDQNAWENVFLPIIKGNR